MVNQACPPPSRRGRQLAVKGGHPHHLSADLRVWHVRRVGQAADQPGKQAERRGTLSRDPQSLYFMKVHLHQARMSPRRKRLG